jgi:putative iron-regulated protein
MKQDLENTMAAMQAMVERAENIEAYDQMIGEGNDSGNATVQAAVDMLVGQTRSIERIVQALNVADVKIEGSDSLDDPDSVFQ